MSEVEEFYPDHQIARDIDDPDFTLSINSILFDESRFQYLNLDKRILRGLQRAGFRKPSSIQLQAIPLGRIGVDMVLQSRSGTGKTCTYTVIAMEALINTNDAQVLIVTPTREIAFQVSLVFRNIGAYLDDLKVALVTGGFKVHRDAGSVRNAQIVIGTPGRIIQLIELSHLRTSAIRLLILDEADKLFEDQMISQLDALYALLPESKQVIAVSATFPDELAKRIDKYLKEPEYIKVDEEVPFPEKNAQFYAVVPKSNALHSKIEIVKKFTDNVSYNQLIIFVNSRESGQVLHEEFERQGWDHFLYLFGDMPQIERYEVFKKFHGIKHRALVSTDLFARGVDCQGVNMIINFDLALDKETFLHRVGRAGRFGGDGITLTLLEEGEEEKAYNDLAEHFGFKKIELPADLRKDYPWGFVDPSYVANRFLSTEELLDRLRNRVKYREKPCRKKNRHKTYDELMADWLEFKNKYKEDPDKPFQIILPNKKRNWYWNGHVGFRQKNPSPLDLTPMDDETRYEWHQRYDVLDPDVGIVDTRPESDDIVEPVVYSDGDDDTDERSQGSDCLHCRHACGGGGRGRFRVKDGSADTNDQKAEGSNTQREDEHCDVIVEPIDGSSNRPQTFDNCDGENGSSRDEKDNYKTTVAI